MKDLLMLYADERARAAIPLADMARAMKTMFADQHAWKRPAPS